MGSSVGPLLLKILVPILGIGLIAVGWLASQKPAPPPDLPAQNQNPPAPATVSLSRSERVRSVISGRVLDSSGKPLLDVQVTLQEAHECGLWYECGQWQESGPPTDTVLLEVKTGTDGTYRAALDLDEAQATVPIKAIFAAKGHGVHQEGLTLWGVPPPPEFRRPDVTLAPAVDLKGVVLDHRGRPVADVIVPGRSVSPYTMQIAVSMPAAIRARTDKEGRFHLEGLNSTAHGSDPAVWLERPDGTQFFRDSAVKRGDVWEIRLFDYGRVSGRVIDGETGLPLARARVECREWVNMNGGPALRFAETDQRGAFEIADLKPAYYELFARAAAAYGHVWDVRIHPGEHVTCDIRTEQATDATCKLSFRDSGRPAPNVEVWFTSGEYRSETMRSLSDAHGEITIRGLLPGIYSLHRHWGTGQSWIPERDTPDLKLRLDPPGTQFGMELLGQGPNSLLEIAVSDAHGLAAPNAYVTCQFAGPAIVLTDETGRVQLRLSCIRPNLTTPATVTAISSDKSAWGYAEIPWHWQPGQNLKIVLHRPLSKVTGRVTDPEGHPIRGAQVWAYSDYQQTRDTVVPLLAQSVSATSGADGSYSLSPIDPAVKYGLSAEADGYGIDWESRMKRIAEGQTEHTIVLKKPDRVITGRVLNEKGDPLPGIAVRGYWSSFPEQTTGPDGVFRLEGLVPGDRALVYARGVDYGPEGTIFVPASDTQIAIRFTGRAVATISGKVVHADGSPAGEEMVQISPPNSIPELAADGSLSRAPNNVITDPQGRFVFPRCVPGQTYNLRTNGPEQEKKTFLRDVPAGTKDLLLIAN
jgi:protocatechuate 3,4-dioxygenase beta subunit